MIIRGAHAISDHRHDGSHRDTQTTDARRTAHEVGVDRDPRERHVFKVRLGAVDGTRIWHASGTRPIAGAGSVWSG